MSETNKYIDWFDVPDARLSPNARINPMMRANLVKKLRSSTAERVARLFTGGQLPLWHKVNAKVTFYFPTTVRRDADNLNARLKGFWDGLVDGGLLLDDDQIIHHPTTVEVVKGEIPVMKVEVWE